MAAHNYRILVTPYSVVLGQTDNRYDTMIDLEIC